MKDINKRRRQAAWKCFEPYLNEEQLLDAIRILEQGYQTEGTINLINYIKKVCNQFNIGEQTRKALHLQFHQLMLVPFESAGDPLLKLQALEKARLSAPHQTPANATPVAEEAPKEPTAPEIQQPGHTVLFGLLVTQIVEYCRQTEELFVVLGELIHGDKQHRREFADLLGHWTEKPEDFSWATVLDEKALTRLVHLVYTAVCEILGPVEADHCFHLALAVCEKHPEARRFPPSRFL